MKKELMCQMYQAKNFLPLFLPPPSLSLSLSLSLPLSPSPSLPPSLPALLDIGVEMLWAGVDDHKYERRKELVSAGWSVSGDVKCW